MIINNKKSKILTLQGNQTEKVTPQNNTKLNKSANLKNPDRKSPESQRSESNHPPKAAGDSCKNSV